MLSKHFLSRKSLLRGALLAAGAYLADLLPYPFRKTPSAHALAADNSLVVVTGADISKERITRMVEAGFNAMGGIGAFIKPGMKVVVKPNIAWNSAPERAHNTNPHLVEAVVRMCVRRGARVLVFDRSVSSAQLTYQNSGIADAARRAGASVEYIDSRKFRKVKVPGGLYNSDLSVYGDMIDADFVINMPIAKTHGSSTLTLSMKNLMGVLGGRRGFFHADIHNSIVDFAKAIRVDLNIIDATRILTAHGPNGGDLKDVKETRTIIMGRNMVTVDAYAVTLFNRRPDSIKFIAIAGREGMGETNVNKMTVRRLAV